LLIADVAASAVFRIKPSTPRLSPRPEKPSASFAHPWGHSRWLQGNLSLVLDKAVNRERPALDGNVGMKASTRGPAGLLPIEGGVMIAELHCLRRLLSIESLEAAAAK
jgi:hypothetical protein